MSAKPKDNQEFADAWKYAGWANKALKGYAYVFDKYLETHEPLEYGDFWQMQHKFAEHVIGYGFPFPYSAAHLFMGPTSDEEISYTFTDALRFVKTWKQMYLRTQKLLTDIGLDDEQADALLLTDRDNWENLLKGEFPETDSDLDEFLHEYCEEAYQNEWSGTILTSIHSYSDVGIYERLEAAARGAFAAKVRTSSQAKPTTMGTENEDTIGFDPGDHFEIEFPSCDEGD